MDEPEKCGKVDLNLFFAFSCHFVLLISNESHQKGGEIKGEWLHNGKAVKPSMLPKKGSAAKIFLEMKRQPPTHVQQKELLQVAYVSFG